MADIISFEDKQQLTDEKKAALKKKLKFIAAHKVLQCTRCASKCEKCGSHVTADNGDEKTALRVPYQFCESCSSEYIDYIDKLNGKGDPDCYWHNDEWLRSWRKWIDYQGSVDSYLKTKEFLQLIQELQDDGNSE